jgi:hypothetical protein
VALAALWPRRALLAEADPAGGDLVYRGVRDDGRPLDPGTGILSLAATARRGIAAEQLWDHAQRLSGGLDVLVGLANSEQAAGLTGQWHALARAFAELAASPRQEAAADVLADCGRLDAHSPAVGLLPQAALLLLVTRAQPENLAHTRDRALALHAKLRAAPRAGAPGPAPRIGVLLIAPPQGGGRLAAQVDEMLGAAPTGPRVVGVIAEDAAGAEQLAGRRRGRLDRSLLVRSARKVVADLYQTYGAELAPAGGLPQGATAAAPPAMAYGQPGATAGVAGAYVPPATPGQAGWPGTHAAPSGPTSGWPGAPAGDPTAGDPGRFGEGAAGTHARHDGAAMRAADRAATNRPAAGQAWGHVRTHGPLANDPESGDLASGAAGRRAGAAVTGTAVASPVSGTMDEPTSALHLPRAAGAGASPPDPAYGQPAAPGEAGANAGAYGPAGGEPASAAGAAEAWPGDGPGAPEAAASQPAPGLAHGQPGAAAGRPAPQAAPGEAWVRAETAGAPRPQPGGAPGAPAGEPGRQAGGGTGVGR